MKDVNGEVLGRVLNVYRPEWRYLLEASVEYPRCEGRFLVKESGYLVEDIRSKDEHLTDIEAQLCLNQLYFAFLGQGTIDGVFGQFGNFEQYMNMRGEMVIVESLRRFKKPIPLGQNFQGTIELVRYKRLGSLYVAEMNYDLSDGSCIGYSKLAMKV